LVDYGFYEVQIFKSNTKGYFIIYSAKHLLGFKGYLIWKTFEALRARLAGNARESKGSRDSFQRQSLGFSRALESS
jgi:hypothetical protein